jgi:hypothetical protein
VNDEKKPRRCLSRLGRMKRTENIRVRLSPEERLGAEKEARREGLSLSTFFRRLLSLRIGSGLIRQGTSKAPNGKGGPPPPKTS